MQSKSNPQSSPNQQQPKPSHTATQKHLNWKSILYDQNIFIDSQQFRKWDGNLQFQGQDLLEKDLLRTRSDQPVFQKKSTKDILRKIVTFYCVENRVAYQQGLLEVVIPFALLHRKDFQTRKCYAYFNAFMRRHFPKLLTQRIIDQKKQLPHAILAIHLTQILLKYHYPDLYDIFAQQQIPLSMIVTQQLLTVFAKNVQLPLVYEIYDFFINKSNKNYLLYMCVALIGLKQQEIKQHAQTDSLHGFVNKNLKKINNQQQLSVWLKFSEEIADSTPSSFQLLSKKLSFTQKSILSQEDLTIMMKFQQHLIQFSMPIYRSEMDSNIKGYCFVVMGGKIPSKEYRSLRLKSYGGSNQKRKVMNQDLEEIEELVKIKNGGGNGNGKGVGVELVIGICSEKQEIEREFFIKLEQKLRGTLFPNKVRVYAHLLPMNSYPCTIF